MNEAINELKQKKEVLLIKISFFCHSDLNLKD